MPNDKNFWTTPHRKGWAVRREGKNKVSSIHPTQAEAWGEARRRARGSEGEALLQGRDGKIRVRNSYGNDPYPPKG